MTDQARGVTPSIWGQVDALCDEFEKHRKAGAGQKIESFVDRIDERARTMLVRELVLLEASYLQRDGTSIDWDSYESRFPQFAEGIQEARRRFDAGETRTADGHADATPRERATTATRVSLPRQFGKYELRAVLGRGAFGTVYRAYDEDLDREVALKIPRFHAVSDERDVERFLREARAAAQLKHPSIVTIFEVAEIDGQLYIACELIEGTTLQESLASGERPTYREAAMLLRELAQAVHVAHSRGIIHRDLKPANVLLDTDGAPHIADFGLARQSERDIELTSAGTQLGTPAYMSPEQATGDSHLADARSDVWSLGIILYRLLTGELPFRGDGQKVQVQIQKDEPTRPRTLNAHIPRDLEMIAVKCLEKEPRRRYPSAEALADDLGRFLAGKPIAARPVGRVERSWRWCKRNPVVATLTAAVILVLATGTGVSMYFAIAANARAREATAERTRAEQNLAEANRQRDQAAANLKVAEEQRRRAEEGYGRARQAVDEFYTNVSQNTLLEETRFLPLRRDLIEAALNYYLELGKDRKGDPRIQAEIAATYFRLTVVRGANDSKGLAPLLAGVEILERLVREERDLNELGSLANGWYKNRGEVVVRLSPDEMEQAFAAFRKAASLYEELVHRFPDADGIRNDLAGLYQVLGVLMRGTKDAEALEFCELSRTQYEKLVQDNPEDMNYAMGLGWTYGCLGLVYGDARRINDAFAAGYKARELHERLIREHPTATTVKRHFLFWEVKLGAGQLYFRQFDKAHRTFARMLEIFESLASQSPPDDVMPRVAVLGCRACLRQISKFVAANPALAVDTPLGEISANIAKMLQLKPGTGEYVDYCVRTARFAEAADQLATAIADDPGNHYGWYQASFLYAFRDDFSGHCAHCRKMLARFADTQDPTIAERVAKACLIAPVDGGELKQAVELANRAVELGANHQFHRYFAFAKGLADYRTGNYESASVWLTKSLTTDGFFSGSCGAAAKLLQAMSYWQRGDQGKARDLLAAAGRIDLTSGDWHDWLMAETIRREAQSLIEDASFNRARHDGPATSSP